MKKFLCVALIIVMLSLCSVSALALTVNLNDEQITFPDAKPYAQNDKILVPMRFVFEALKLGVFWDGEAQTVITLDRNSNYLVMQIGNSELYINTDKIVLDKAPVLFESRTMLTSDTLCRILNLDSAFDETTQTLSLYTK